MNRILWIALCAIVQVRIFGQITVQPAVVRSTVIGGITSSAVVIDNRSQALRANVSHTFCATGTGSWSVQVQYADGSTSGPWNGFTDSGSVVNQSSPACTGVGTGYHDYIRFMITGTATVSYGGTKFIWFPSGGSGGGGGNISAVFGRTGSIVATTGDYTAGQVTNAVDQAQTYANPSWITSLAYSKLTGAPSLGTFASLNNPMTTLGDIMTGGTSGAPVRLAGVSAITREFLTSQGIGSAATAPFYSALLINDIPTGYPYANLSGTPSILSNPMTTLGDMLTGGASGAPVRLAGNSTVARQFMTSQGIGSAATAPFLSALVINDIPTGYPYSNLTGTPSLFNQTVGITGTSQTQRGRINIIPSTGMTITAADNPGTGSTDVTFISTSSGGGSPGGTTGDFQINSSSAFAKGNINQGSDTSMNASKGLTWAVPSVPTFNASGTTTCDWSQSNVCEVVFSGGNTTLAFSNPHGSGPYKLMSVLDATGRLYTFPTAVKGGVSNLAGGSGDVNIQEFTYDGSTNYNGDVASCPTCTLLGADLPGSTSGALTLTVAAVVTPGSVFKFPNGSTDLTASGGTSQVLTQTAFAGPIGVRQLAAADLSNGTTGTGAVCLASGSTCSSSGGGQSLSSGAMFTPDGYPGYGSMNTSDPTPSGSQNNGVVVYTMTNKFASLTIGHAAMTGYTATGFVTIGLYNSSCNLIQQSGTVGGSGGTAPIIFTFSVPAVITTSVYYLGVSNSSTGAQTVSQNSNNFNTVVNALTAVTSGSPGNAYAYSAANPSVGTSSMTMPGSCGTRVALTGVNGELPYVIFANN